MKTVRDRLAQARSRIDRAMILNLAVKLLQRHAASDQLESTNVLQALREELGDTEFRDIMYEFNPNEAVQEVQLSQHGVTVTIKVDYSKLIPQMRKELGIDESFTATVPQKSQNAGHDLSWLP